MGGVAAQAFAIHHPKLAAKRVRGLVLMSSLAKTHISGSRRLRCAIERVAEGRLDSAAMFTQPNFGFFLARIGFGRDPQPSHVELTRQMIASCEREDSTPAIQALLGLDLTDELPQLDLPTLVLSGSADLIAPPAESRRIAELVPGARLEVFKGAGHMLMFERTEEVNDLIAEFAREPGVGGWPGGGGHGAVPAALRARAGAGRRGGPRSPDPLLLASRHHV